MKVIGITGGIGSGKSTVSNLLETYLNGYIISMDAVAHQLMSRGGSSYQLIVDFFGDKILKEDKEIDRKKLGEIVYKDKEKLLLINSFTHPFVLEEVKKIIEEKGQEHAIIGIETALPREGKLDSFCDEIWYVYTPIPIRKRRLMESRGLKEETIDEILLKQISEEEYKALSTQVIVNDGSMEKVLEQIKVLAKNLGDFSWNT